MPAMQEQLQAMAMDGMYHPHPDPLPTAGEGDEVGAIKETLILLVIPESRSDIRDPVPLHFNEL